jgi:pimeloyl-ACP methyl ester carboxylesterase
VAAFLHLRHGLVNDLWLCFFETYQHCMALMHQQFITTPQGRKIAFFQNQYQGRGIVFLGGFKSDMTGTKALFLEDWANTHKHPFLRFDYSGHGASSGSFLDGSIGDWFEDALAVISAQTEGRQILVGSSMGGWISLLLARAIPEKIAGFVGVAAAPDFTEDSFWHGFDTDAREALLRDGQVLVPSGYADEPYVITRRLIEDGKNRLVLRQPLSLLFPVRLLQGTADVDVPQEVALRLLAHAQGSDIQLALVKGADHRFSSVKCLNMIVTAIDDILMVDGASDA